MAKRETATADICDTVAHISAGPDESRTGDARTRRSFAALQAALLELLERREFEQVSVREICKVASVHYATFFRHVPSKEALLDRVGSQEIARMISLALPAQDAGKAYDAIATMCDYIGERRPLWNTLLNGGASVRMRQEWLSQAREVSALRAPYGSWLPKELGTVCSVTLIIETIAWWLRQPERAYSGQQVTGMLHRMISNSAFAGDTPQAS